MLANAASTAPFSKGSRETAPATSSTLGRPRVRRFSRATPSIAGAPSMPTTPLTGGAIPAMEPAPMPQPQGGAVGRVQPGSADRAAPRRFAHLHHGAERRWERLLTRRASAAIHVPSLAHDHPRRHPIGRFLRLSIALIHPSAWKGALRTSENPLQAKFASWTHKASTYQECARVLSMCHHKSGKGVDLLREGCAEKENS